MRIQLYFCRFVTHTSQASSPHMQRPTRRSGRASAPPPPASALTTPQLGLHCSSAHTTDRTAHAARRTRHTAPTFHSDSRQTQQAEQVLARSFPHRVSAGPGPSSRSQAERQRQTRVAAPLIARTRGNQGQSTADPCRCTTHTHTPTTRSSTDGRRREARV